MINRFHANFPTRCDQLLVNVLQQSICVDCVKVIAMIIHIVRVA